RGAIPRDGGGGVRGEGGAIDAEPGGREGVSSPDPGPRDRDSVRHTAVGNRGAAGDDVRERVHFDDRACPVRAAEVSRARRVEVAVGGGADEPRVLALQAIAAAQVDERDVAVAGGERGEEPWASVYGPRIGVALVRERHIDAPGGLGHPLR